MDTLISFILLILVALMVEPLAKRVHLPFSAVLVIVGFIGSEVIVRMGFDTGLRWYHFTDLILELFLPVLVFASAFCLNVRMLIKTLVPILYLTVPLMLVATLLTGTLIYLGIAHPTGFPLAVALLTGALLSATDPVAVVALFQRLGAPLKLQVLMEGESLFNDATAIVLFTLLLSVALMPEQSVSVVDGFLAFLRVFFGGISCGVLIGLIGVALMKVFAHSMSIAILTIAGATISFYLSEHLFNVSGVMAVLVTGLLMGDAYRAQKKDQFPAQLWELNAYIAESLIFLLVGITITIHMFKEQWLAMLIGIGAVLITRFLITFVLIQPIQWFKGVTRISFAYRTVMFWGGLRGAVTLALALSLPLELNAWWTVQSIAYGVVLFTVFVQAPSTEPLLYKLGIIQAHDSHT